MVHRIQDHKHLIITILHLGLQGYSKDSQTDNKIQIYVLHFKKENSDLENSDSLECLFTWW